MDSATATGLIISSVGAVAAVAAATYAGLAPSRRDLKRVEHNTAETSARVAQVETHIKSVDGRLQEQHIREMTEALARKVRISVHGSQQDPDAAFPITLETKGGDATLVSIDMLNEAGAFFASAACDETAPGKYVSSIDALVAARWYAGGELSAAGHRLVLRAHLMVDGRETKREFAVYISISLKQGPHSQYYGYTIEGDC